MSEHDFQTELLRRFDLLSHRIEKVDKDLAALRSSLDERCGVRGEQIKTLSKDQQGLWAREHKRAGGKTMLATVGAAAGAVGGLLSKLLPFGGGQ